MAIEAIKKDEQEQGQGFNTQNQQPEQTSAPTLGGQQSSQLGQDVGQGQNKQIQGGQAQEGRKGSGMGARLTNLKKYIETNRGANMAQKIQGGIEGIRSNVQQGIGQAQSKFQEKTGAEKQRITQGQQLVKGTSEGGLGVFEKGKSEVFTGQQTQPIEGQQAPDFSQYGQTAQDRLSNFAKYRQGEAQQFDIENQLDLEQQAKELQKRADLSQSEAGRYQLLRETFKRPAYTTGQQRLDQLLLQANPEQSKQLQEMTKTIAQPVQEQLSQLKSTKEAENKAITEQASALKSDIAKRLYGDVGQANIDYTTGQIKDIGTGELSKFTQGLEEQRKAVETNLGKEYNRIQDKIQRGEPITQEEIQKVTDVEGQNLSDFMDYYKKGVKKTVGEKIAANESLSDYEQAMVSNKVAPLLKMTPEKYVEIKNFQPLDMTNFAINRTGTNEYMADEGGFYRYGSYTQPDENEPRENLVPVINNEGQMVFLKPVKDYNKGLTEQYNSYINKINQTKQVLDDLTKQAIISSPQISSYRALSDIDFSKYLTGLKPEDVQVGRTATTEDYARQEALRKLADLQFGPLNQQEVSQANTAAQQDVGRLALERGLSSARDFYAKPDYSSLGRVGLPEESISEHTNLEGLANTPEVLGNTIDKLASGDILGTLGGAGQITMNIFGTPIDVIGDVENLLTGGNNVRDMYDSVQGMASSITRSRSFWCTKVYELGLVSKEEYKKIQLFLNDVKFKQSPFLSWYITYGSLIAHYATFLDFDWNIGKKYLFDKLLPLYESGDLEGAVKCYDKFTVEICNYINVNPPYHTRNPSFLSCLIHYPKVLCYYTKLKLKRLLCKI